MSPRFSHYLDFVRFSAAFVVLLSHFAYERFTQGYYSIIRDFNLGSDAVVLFFVLSGFVISFAATQKDKNLSAFTFSRLTRLYTVAIPALILTLFCDFIGLSLNSDFYTNTGFYNALSWDVYWIRGLTFSNYWMGDSIRLGSNGPFWSLSYEAAYYCLFAFLLFTKGFVRIATVVLCLFIFGLKILLLAPAWFFGSAAYFALQKYRDKRIKKPIIIAMITLPIVSYIFMLAVGVAPFLRSLTYVLVGDEMFWTLAFSDEFLWNGLLGLLFTIHLSGVNLWLSREDIRPRGESLVKWLAGASFSIYLVHYPILQTLGATMPKTEFVLLNHLILLTLTCIFCFAFAAIFERPLHRVRSVLKLGWSKTQKTLLTLT